MPAAAAVADPELNEFEVGGRWFGCAPHIDPELLVGVMRRAQRAPTDVTDPIFDGWLTTIVSFLLAATDPGDHDAFIATCMAVVGEDREAAVEEIGVVFAGLLALFVDQQMDEIREWIVEDEKRRSALTPFPAREQPVVRRRATVADIERINRKHRRKATGEVIG
jgi:hypothetical protein